MPEVQLKAKSVQVFRHLNTGMNVCQGAPTSSNPSESPISTTSCYIPLQASLIGSAPAKSYQQGLAQGISLAEFNSATGRSWC